MNPKPAILPSTGSNTGWLRLDSIHKEGKTLCFMNVRYCASVSMIQNARKWLNIISCSDTKMPPVCARCLDLQTPLTPMRFQQKQKHWCRFQHTVYFATNNYKGISFANKMHHDKTECI